MTLFRRLMCVCAVAGSVVTLGAGVAQAETFYVNQRGGEDTNNCTKTAECETVQRAIAVAETFPGPNTIDVDAEGEPQKGPITLNKASDKGLAIVGTEREVEIRGGGPLVTVGAAAGAVTISNIKLTDLGGAGAAIVDTGAGLTLANDTVEMESGTNGIEANGGSLAVEDDTVILESATGYAISAIGAPLTVSGVSIANGNGGIGSESSGIDSRKSTLAVSDTTVSNEASSKTTQFGIVAESDSSTTIRNTTVKQGGAGIGVIFELSPVTVEKLNVEMMNPASKVEAVDLETIGGSSTFSHLETSGTWVGPAMFADAGNVTLSDSRLATNLSAKAEALRYTSEKATTGLVIRRSILQAAAKATPSALLAFNGDVTLDSTEVFGGTSGVSFKSEAGATRTLTVAASTVGGAPGISLEAPGPIGVDAEATGSTSVANVAIEGSILFQAQAATVGLGGHATVTCSYSAAPSQIQTAKPSTTGDIACAAGTSGNTNSAAEAASLFANRLISYELSPSSSAVDSVPASAISLPFGLTSSSTDLAGRPRVTDGNGDCVAVQDKGALELQGHAAACPTPISAPAPGGSTKLVPPPLLRPAITALAISPSAFFAAPFGATISKASKKRYGATISWRDSVTATTTFTVMRPSAGRRQGRSCKKPSKRNKHGKRCTLLSKVGAFTHVDVAGANSVHFSGRVKGKLTPDNYVLQALPRNGAGAGAVVSRPFKIK